jgi:hypothetical protein
MAQPVTVEALRARPVVGAVDSSVKIPQAVIDAGKRAEDIQRQLAGTAEPPAQSPDGSETDADPSAQPQVPRSTRDEPAAGEPAAGEPAAGDPANWERRFKGLQGRYDHDVRQVKDQLGQMSDQIQRLHSENASLRAARTPPAEPPPTQSLLSEQEIADYGPEFIDVARRVAREVAAPLHAEILNLRSQLGHVQQETGNSFLTRMDDQVGSQVKNWRELNVDPRFVEWTKLPDVFSGAIRQQLMQDAWNAGDARRVAAFFQAFLAEEAAVDPQRANGRPRPASRMTVTPTPSPVTAPQSAPRLALEDLAAPGRAHSASGAPAEKPVYTSADITRFYTDVKLGRWRGNEQQQAAIDADIMLAQREGRIVVDQRTAQPLTSNGAIR